MEVGVNGHAVPDRGSGFRVVLALDYMVSIQRKK